MNWIMNNVIFLILNKFNTWNMTTDSFLQTYHFFHGQKTKIGRRIKKKCLLLLKIIWMLSSFVCKKDTLSLFTLYYAAIQDLPECILSNVNVYENSNERYKYLFYIEPKQNQFNQQRHIFLR